MQYILIFFLMTLTVGLIACLVFFEIRNKPIKWRLLLLIAIFLDFIFNSFFYAEYKVFAYSFSQALMSNSREMNTLIEVGRSDRHLLNGIRIYLQEGKNIAILEKILSDLDHDMSNWLKPSMISPEYNYKVHIEKFNKIGNELIERSEE